MQIADMKEYIARFGHGSAKLARQAQVRASCWACWACWAGHHCLLGLGWLLRVWSAPAGWLGRAERRLVEPSMVFPPVPALTPSTPAFLITPFCKTVQGEGAGQDGAGGSDREGGDGPHRQVQVHQRVSLVGFGKPVWACWCLLFAQQGWRCLLLLLPGRGALAGGALTH